MVWRRLLDRQNRGTGMAWMRLAVKTVHQDIQYQSHARYMYQSLQAMCIDVSINYIEYQYFGIGFSINFSSEKTYIIYLHGMTDTP